MNLPNRLVINYYWRFVLRRKMEFEKWTIINNSLKILLLSLKSSLESPLRIIFFFPQKLPYTGVLLGVHLSILGASHKNTPFTWPYWSGSACTNAQYPLHLVNLSPPSWRVYTSAVRIIECVLSTPLNLCKSEVLPVSYSSWRAAISYAWHIYKILCCRGAAENVSSSPFIYVFDAIWTS